MFQAFQKFQSLNPHDNGLWSCFDLSGDYRSSSEGLLNVWNDWNFWNG